MQPTAQPPSYPPPYQPPPARRPWYKRGWFIAAVAFVVGGAIGSASQAGNSKTVTHTVAGPTVMQTTPVYHYRTEIITEPARTVTAPAHTVRAPAQTVAAAPSHPAVSRSFGDGTYLVGTDIRAGMFHTDGGTECYWERDRNLDGGINSIIANNLSSGPMTIHVAASDRAVQFNGGCVWHRI